MPGEAIGEPILLIWEGWPQTLFVKGHLPQEAALRSLGDEDLLVQVDRHYDKDRKEWIWGWYEARLSVSFHRYARWSIEPGPDGCSQVLRDYTDPGRGRFPVTQFEIISWDKVKEADSIESLKSSKALSVRTGI
ncbi:MAG: hypothetical protein WC749_01975 [Dehalococcoidia bacterium]